VQLGGALLLALTASLMPHLAGAGSYPAGALRFVTGCALTGLAVALTGLHGRSRA
jgi:hypothetical protein